LAGSTALAVLALLLVWLGVYPAPVIEMILKAISGAI
jgi:NADH:ubiquinone oxidoreductase subunit 4 (subunit M)